MAAIIALEFSTVHFTFTASGVFTKFVGRSFPYGWTWIGVIWIEYGFGIIIMVTILKYNEICQQVTLLCLHQNNRFCRVCCNLIRVYADPADVPDFLGDIRTFS